ncbi:hypothetical protein [Pseudoflavitalea rhizosphaerae]|uniref:hypothetical protein n=1 Tax=Pseudoflavitalea rhizosphaerae TaxID=1884793 RepID=UPI000F8DF8A2|nr:hypothetical protein [Pseudoflavitalea rhizosphaerae]
MQIADINELVAVLKIQKSNNLGAMIFLGAGASVTGNVPLADQLAQALLENDLYKPLLSNTPNKEYGTLMGCLTPAMRKAFLKPYMENAQINETHLYASFLVESGYIDTVLTVNFDPLTYLPFQYTKTRPNIYDVTGHSGIVLGGIEYPAIVFLHGQHHGFWQMNTNQEMHATLRNTKEVLTSLLSTRTLIIIGYSGRDPIFQVLQEIPKFEHNLYWIGYNEFPPPIHIKDNLLNEEHRSVKFLPGFDSDSFFRTLCKELGVQLPSIFSNPQKFLLEKAKLLADHKNVESGQSLKEELLKSINKLQGDYYQFKFQVIASPNFVTPEIQKLIQSLEQIIKQEEFSKAEELASEVLKSKNSMVFGLMSEALTGFGDNLIQLGKASNNKDLVQVGIDKLHLAITYYPISELIWCKIGDGLILLSSLVNWDLTKVDKAIQKFDNALKINTKSAYPRFRKGVCYVIKAKITGNNIELWEKALQQFKIYNRSSDKMSDHLTQIADLYAEYAKLSNSGENYEKAFGYYKQSFSMEEGNLDNLLNWANALIQYSKFKVNSSTELYMAIDKLSVIQKTNSDLYRLHILFGLAYSLLAKNSGSKTKENYGKSYEHYQRAIKIEPGNYISYFNWGVSLYEKALQENSNLKLLHEAKSRFEKANEIHEYDEGYFYLGLIYWNIYNKTKKSADQKKIY